MSTLPQFELKPDTANIPPGLRTNDKSHLNQVCQTLYKHPPTFSTVTEHHTTVTLPDGRSFSATSTVHSDSQIKAARLALTALNRG